MEVQGLRQLGSTSRSGKTSVESAPSTEYEQVHLDKLEPSASLTDQYGHCSRDIKRCIIQAQQAVLDVENLSRLMFEPIENRLKEHNLRLDIWSSDCGVAKGYLEHIGRLSQPVRDIFGRFHEQLETASEQINNFRKDVPKKFAESNPYSVKANKDARTLVDRHISELRKTCDEMTRILLELCELQPLIQTAQALDQVGPQRELRNDVLQLKSQYPQDASSDITRSSVSSAGKTGGDGENREQCTVCNKWFAFGTLDFHQDLCSGAGVQEEDTQPSGRPPVGQAREVTPLPVPPSSNKAQAPQSQAATTKQHITPLPFWSAPTSGQPSTQSPIVTHQSPGGVLEPIGSKSSQYPGPPSPEGSLRISRQVESDNSRENFLQRYIVEWDRRLRYISPDFLSHCDADTKESLCFRDTHVYSLNNEAELHVYKEMDLTSRKKDALSRYLWLAASSLPSPLHTQKLKGREILITEHQDLHLITYRRKILIKPLPMYLLDPAYFAGPTDLTILGRGHLFLVSYTYLIRFQSDYQIAIDLSLLPKEIDWLTWTKIVRAVDTSGEPEFRHGDLIYYCWELQGARLDLLSLFSVLNLKPWKKYIPRAYIPSSFTTTLLKLLVILLLFITLLTALNLALASNYLGDPGSLGTASFWIAIITMVLLGLWGIDAVFTELYLPLLNFARTASRFRLQGRQRRDRSEKV